MLVCVYNKHSRLITHDIFYRLFSQYGEVKKILIFQKSKVWKIFVQMDCVQSALQCKVALNNYNLFNDGSKMNIFNSNLEEINLINSNTGGIDYTQIKPKIE